MNNIKKYALDTVENVAKTSLSALPIGGTLITCVYDTIKANTVQKRLNEWKSILEERFSKVEKTLYEIGNNELFSSCIMKATDTALKTAQREKRKYLANAVYNSIFVDIDESIIMIYLDMMERYTVIHIKVLLFLNDPSSFGIKTVNMLSNLNTPRTPENCLWNTMFVLKNTIQELRGKDAIINRVVKDLYFDGLIDMERLGIVTGAKHTTELGTDFLRFITID